MDVYQEEYYAQDNMVSAVTLICSRIQGAAVKTGSTPRGNSKGRSYLTTFGTWLHHVWCALASIVLGVPLVDYLSEVSKRLRYTLYTISKGRNTEGNYKRRTGAVLDLSSVVGLPQAMAVSQNKGNYGISLYGVKEGTRMEGSIKSVRYSEVTQRARV